MLQNNLDDVLASLKRAAVDSRPQLRVQEVGHIRQIGGGIARVSGLDSVTADELVECPGGVLALATNLDPGRGRTGAAWRQRTGWWLAAG